MNLCFTILFLFSLGLASPDVRKNDLSKGSLNARSFAVNTTTTTTTKSSGPTASSYTNTTSSITATKTLPAPLATSTACLNSTKLVNLKTDSQNCGACGHACASGTCENGFCSFAHCDRMQSCFASEFYRFPCEIDSDWIGPNTCGCLSSSTGRGFCGIIETSSKCADTEQRCKSSSECPTGEVCVNKPCCGAEMEDVEISVCRPFTQCSPYGNASFVTPPGANPSTHYTYTRLSMPSTTVT